MTQGYGKTDKWMPLDIGAYLSDTAHLNTEQHGAYLLLLFSYWKHQSALIDNDAYLASTAKLTMHKWMKMRTILAQFFTIKDGHWHQKRADFEIDKARRISATRKETGKLGAVAAWGKRPGRKMANAMANARKPSEELPERDQWQTDAQSQLQKEITPTEPVSAAGAGSLSVEKILFEGCKILGVDLQADVTRISWPGEIARLVQHGCTAEHILQSFRKVAERGNGQTARIGYIASIATRLRDEDAAGGPKPGPSNFRSGPSVAIVSSREAILRRLLTSFSEKGIWPASEGPPPNNDDCIVDPTLLIEFGFRKGAA